MEAKAGEAVPVTTCDFENNTGIDFKLDDQKFWHGTGTPPTTIGATARFVHTGDNDVGSVGGLSYVLGDQEFAKWIVAWSNKLGGTENQVYTTVLSGKDVVVWDDIYYKLVKSGPTSSETAHGYMSDVKIDVGTIFPNMVASFSTPA